MKPSNKFDFIVVGGGPSGAFFVYEMLQKNPNARILVIERGKSVENRKCPEPMLKKCVKCKPFCNITSGFSGAGAFSDGKLSLFNEDDEDFYVGGNLHKYIGVEETKRVIKYTDDVYLKFGATTELEGISNPVEVSKIRRKAKNARLDLVNIPIRHLGTDRAHAVYKKLQDYLLEKGATIFFETEVVDLIVSNDTTTIEGVVYKRNHSGLEETAFADKVILAVGRAGADWLEEMCKKHKINSSPAVLDVGVRYELPDQVMAEINDYLYEGKFIGEPDPCHNKTRTFCQNPSGFVSAEVYKNGLILANGHSCKDAKSTNTNLALLVSIKLPDVDSPMEYSRNIGRILNDLAKGNVMVQRLEDLRLGKETSKEELDNNSVVPTLKSAVPGDISMGMPYRVVMSILGFIDMMEKVVPGFANPDNLIYAPELKFYSNKVKLSKNFETNISGLYAIGDGCGLTRGLMMASAAGVVLAQNIM